MISSQCSYSNCRPQQLFFILCIFNSISQSKCPSFSLLLSSHKVFGLGSVAQVVTGQGAFGHYISINLGFGLGVAMGVHVGGKVSGRKAPAEHLCCPCKKNKKQQPMSLLLSYSSSAYWSGSRDQLSSISVSSRRHLYSVLPRSQTGRTQDFWSRPIETQSTQQWQIIKEKSLAAASLRSVIFLWC